MRIFQLLHKLMKCKNVNNVRNYIKKCSPEMKQRNAQLIHKTGVYSRVTVHKLKVKLQYTVLLKITLKFYVNSKFLSYSR